MNPPAEDCSPGEVSSGVAVQSPDGIGTASLPEEGTYRTLDEIKAEARRKFLRPAQQARVAERDTPRSSDTALAAEADDDQPDVRRPLTRQERRARKRRLARVLAKR